MTVRTNVHAALSNKVLLPAALVCLAFLYRPILRDVLVNLGTVEYVHAQGNGEVLLRSAWLFNMAERFGGNEGGMYLVCLARRDADCALDSLQAAPRGTFRDTLLDHWLGIAHHLAGDDNAASRAWLAAGDWGNLLKLAENRAIKDPEFANQLYLQVLASKRATAGVQANANFSLGMLLYEQAQYAEAERHFTAAAAVYPRSFSYQLWLGLSEIALRKWQEAKQHLLVALDLRPGDSYALLYLGDVARLTCKAVEADAYYTQSLQADPSNVTVQDRLRRYPQGGDCASP